MDVSEAVPEDIDDVLDVLTAIAARASGFRTIALDVFAHHTAAIALYESHGFQREDVLRRQISRANGERWDAVAMGLPL